MVRAGQLKEFICISREITATYDSASGMETVVEFDPILKTHALVKEVTFNSEMVASQEDWKETLEFTIRSREGLDVRNGDVIDWRGRRFEIISAPVSPLTQDELKMTARWQG